MQTSTRIGYLALVLALGLIFSSCGSKEDPSVTEARKKAEEIKKIEAIQARILNLNDIHFDQGLYPSGILYIRDDRPKPALCFAYMWSGTYPGGPGLAEVPCQNVRDLLAPSQQRKMEQEQAAR